MAKLKISHIREEWRIPPNPNGLLYKKNKTRLDPIIENVINDLHHKDKLNGVLCDE